MYFKCRRFVGGCAGLVLVLIHAGIPAVAQKVVPKDITLASNGTSGYVVILSAEASSSEQYAAAQLQNYFAAITGCQLNIVKDVDAPPQGPAICIGTSKRTTELLPNFDVATLKEEGIAIKTVDDNVLLLGSRTRGALYATYTFLERLGVRFYSPSVERVPQQSSLTFPETSNIHYPSFHFRLVTYLQYLDPAYSCKMKINMNPLSPPEFGGNLPISMRHMTHTFYQLLPPEKYFDAHPEYFAMVEGQRRNENAQLCLTNPDTIRIATETVLEWMREEPDSRTFGVVQNDSLGYCECDQCRAVDEKEGSHSGSLIAFCNQIAKAVAQQYPDVDMDGIPKKMIHTIAYTYTQKPPKTIKPEPNLTVVMCHMYPSCDSHSIQACALNKSYRDDMAGWLAFSPRMLVWHYVVITHFVLPVPELQCITNRSAMVQGSRRERGVVPGSRRQASSANFGTTSARDSFGTSNENVDALVDDFIDGFYGPAAQPMRTYFNLIHEQVKDPERHMHLYSGLEAGYLPPEVGEQITKIFDEAEVRAKDQPDFLKRVRKERLADWYTHLIRHPKFIAKDGYIEAEDRELRTAWLDQFLSTARANGLTRHCEDLPLTVFEQRQKFLCEKYHILSLAEFAPTIQSMMDAAYAESQSKAKIINGKPYLNVMDMEKADIGKWFGEGGLVELEHYYNEYNITQRSPFDIWTRYLSEEDYKKFTEPRLK